ncbi:class D sortase [Bacillus sp. ISL-45]|uniref:class D sortase n=1 Tax=Bacillus sp. ISL-45 TaxID=2819128 RepID=UPI001BE50ECC|nr:class D sortase [Bacillus sp. ISL-45]MBT2660576.1 class D sortase [Bacillus sp. ISL-45]
MNLSKILAIGIVVSGVIILGIGLFQIWDIKKQEQVSLAAAKELVQENTPMANKKEFKPVTGEASGLLLIPKIDAELAIVEGTDPDDLEKGVGHYKGSFYPEENGQIVLSGHRDTVFQKAGELVLGDLLTMKMPYGDYTYVITGTKIVSADDTSIINLQNSEEELLLTTCYPFSYIGDAPERYIIYAKRILDKN